MAAFKQLSQCFVRNASTTPSTTKAAGDISSVFPSLSGKAPEPLPTCFQALKKQLVEEREIELSESWSRLLVSLREEIKKIKELGSDVRRAVLCPEPLLMKMGPDYPLRELCRYQGWKSNAKTTR
jgi:hypothetical protein